MPFSVFQCHRCCACKKKRYCIVASRSTCYYSENIFVLFFKVSNTNMPKNVLYISLCERGNIGGSPSICIVGKYLKILILLKAQPHFALIN